MKKKNAFIVLRTLESGLTSTIGQLSNNLRAIRYYEVSFFPFCLGKKTPARRLAIVSDIV